MRLTISVPACQEHGLPSAEPAGAWRFGQAMPPLREAGVLIICSGSLTHNLYEFRGQHGPASDYVTRFADWTAEALRKGDLQTLLDYRQNAPEAERAHPSDEHFLPLFVALSAAGSGYELEMLEGSVAYGVLAMDSYLFSSPSHTRRYRYDSRHRIL
ncbi:DODA-type extradiol aromatic ring-opening family dioxygenase [Azotobacter beijerinckii]|uniref:dioxygenase family protein n=1 Tax=Azotobacter beijerinckii TaxID=170623 RepID=UPI000B85F021